MMKGKVEVRESFSSFRSIHPRRKLHLPLFYKRISLFFSLQANNLNFSRKHFQSSRQTLFYTALWFHPTWHLFQDVEHIQLTGTEGYSRQRSFQGHQQAKANQEFHRSKHIFQPQAWRKQCLPLAASQIHIPDSRLVPFF